MQTIWFHLKPYFWHYNLSILTERTRLMAVANLEAPRSLKGRKRIYQRLGKELYIFNLFLCKGGELAGFLNAKGIGIKFVHIKLKLFDSPLTIFSDCKDALRLIHKRPLRWKRMVACKRGLGSGPLSFFPRVSWLQMRFRGFFMPFLRG